MEMIKKCLVSLMVTLTMLACKKEEIDETAPVITISSPQNEQVVKAGETISFKGVITDNEGLGTFQYEIHEGEGHDHKSGTSESVEWEVKQSVAISGTSYTINESILVPKNAEATEYHFIVNAIDAAGNAAVFIELNIDLER